MIQNRMMEQASGCCGCRLEEVDPAAGRIRGKDFNRSGVALSLGGLP
jgi:hypothetical protein